jgi:ATP-binding protein involved in chromosome partitioning
VKAAKMASMTGHAILGVVENMAYFDCGTCGSRHFLFGRGGGTAIAEAMDITLLASIPPSEEARQAGDAGQLSVLDGYSIVEDAFRELARRVAGTHLRAPARPEFLSCAPEASAAAHTSG